MNLHPYPELAFQFRRAIEDAALAIFVGSSLRDPDMRHLYRTAAERVPTFAVGRSVRVQPVTKGHPICQTASKFLAATLPTALLSSDPINFLRHQSGEREPDKGILVDLSTAMDKNKDGHKRCDAIEKLADASVALPAETIRPLLADADSEVRTFSLALVMSCASNAELLREAEAVAETSGDGVFREELVMLRRVITPRDSVQ